MYAFARTCREWGRRAHRLEPDPVTAPVVLRTVAAILANPRYTGRQVWNRQPSEPVRFPRIGEIMQYK
jgi:hypothetical protein